MTERTCDLCGYPASDDLGQLVKVKQGDKKGEWHFPCLRAHKDILRQAKPQTKR